MTSAAAYPSSGGCAGYAPQDKLVPWVALLVCLGLALRLFAGSGDLWLDEIWSLELVGRLASVDQVFWRINHDNNHFLNSAYLYLTGPDVSPLVHRAPAILFGVCSIAAAALVVRDRGRTTQLLTGLLLAVSYPMVHYGSEARGYSGLILSVLLAVFCLERILDRRGSTVALAAVILFGFLSHVTMAAAVAVLVAWSAWVMLRRGDGPFRAGLQSVMIFLPALLALIPLALCIVFGAATYGLTLGGSEPFTFDDFLTGYGGMIRYLFGFPAETPDWLLIVLASALVCLTAWKWPDRRASLYVIGIVGLPGLMAQLHLPNLEFPRYFLVSGVLLLLWLAEMLGRGIDAGGWMRWTGACVAAAVLLGNAYALCSFLSAGRGSYESIVETMTREGAADYASSNDFRTPKVVDFFASRLDRDAHLVPSGDWCARAPDWLLVEMKEGTPAATEHAPGCNLTYDRVEATRSWGLSGVAWALYRKRGTAG
jgi:hypothetical protein